METIKQMADAVLCRVCERLRYRNEYTISPSIPELVETELNVLFEKMQDSEADSVARGILDYAIINLDELKPQDFQGALPDYIRDKKDKHKGKISTIDDLEFVFWGYIWLCAAAVLNNNTPTPHLTTEVEKVIKETILPIWKKEVLENTTDDAFLNAITTANFSAYYIKGKKQKVGYFIYSLKQIMGDTWANTVISKLPDKSASLSNFQKHPIKDIKEAMNGIVVVNTAGAQFKIDTKTQYTEKGINQPYYKATKR